MNDSGEFLPPSLRSTTVKVDQNHDTSPLQDRFAEDGFVFTACQALVSSADNHLPRTCNDVSYAGLVEYEASKNHAAGRGSCTPRTMDAVKCSEVVRWASPFEERW